MIATFLLAHWRAIGALVIVLILAGYIEGIRLERDHAYNERDKIANQFIKFKGDTETLGKQAEAAKTAKEKADKDRQEKADAENARSTNDLIAAVAKLRNDRSGSRFVPQAAACAGSADRAGFDRAELERALREFDTGVQSLIDEGSKAVIDLNSAKRWANPAPFKPH